MRLQKYMAMCGVAARRKCEEMIAAGASRLGLSSSAAVLEGLE